MTVVVVHQPDLLPYTGFWHKMVNCDVFVILAHDQFVRRGYQRRVMMRGSWVNLDLVGRPRLEAIANVEVMPGWREKLVRDIRGRYQGAPMWKERGDEFCAALLHLPECETLSAVNTSMIRLVRSLLGISTKLVFSDPWLTAKGVNRVIAHVLQVNGDVYLAGQGAKAYMEGTEDLFASSGIELRWSTHVPYTSDSILTPYFDLDDPMKAVLV